MKGKPLPTTEPLPPVFDLKWFKPELAEASADVVVAEFEQDRRFAHIGAAIAWARRQLFHGKVFGEAIEMTTVHRTRILETDAVQESEERTIDITLAGFSKWDSGYDYSSRSSGLVQYPPIRKCRASRV